jgi:hypothetical protein
MRMWWWMLPVLLAACERDIKLTDPDEPEVVDSDTVDPVVDTATDTAVAASGSPRLSVSPRLLDFGYVPEGDLATADIEIRNDGDAPLELTDFALGGSTAFAASLGTELVVPAGGVVAVPFTFASTADLEVATWSLTSNDTGLPSASIQLQGTGEDPAVVGAALDFGFVHVDAPSTLAWVVDNPGNQPTTIDAITSSNPAFTVTLPQPLVLDPATSATVDITFDPVGIGPDSTELTVVSDARVPWTPVTATGEGVADPVAVCTGGPRRSTSAARSRSRAAAAATRQAGRSRQRGRGSVSRPAAR